MQHGKKTPTTFVGNMVAIRQALASYGVDADRIFQEAGLDLSPFDGDSHRVPIETVDRAICLAIEATGDPAFGLKFANYIYPTSYHALGIALLYSSTLHSFCRRLERYFHLITTIEDTRYIEVEGGACLSSSPLGDGTEMAKRGHSDGWAAMVIKFIRMMYRPDYAPAKVALMGAPPEPVHERYREYFKAPVEFNAPANAIYIDSSDLEVPLPASNADLARQNDQLVIEFLARMDGADLPTQVYAKLIEFLPSGDCSREKIAKALNMSVRTFHNKLESAGTNYQRLLDQTRRELAEQYMKKKELSVSEVAYLLGFTDLSNFSRAFKRWTGTSPRKYRDSTGSRVSST